MPTAPCAPPAAPTFGRSPRARREGDDGLAPPPGGFAALHGRIVAMSGKLMGGGRRRRSGSLYDRWENRRSVAARGDAPYVFAQPFVAAGVRGWRRGGAPADCLGAPADSSGAPAAGWWCTTTGGGRCGRSTA